MRWLTVSSTKSFNGELQTFNTNSKIRSVKDLKQEFGFSAAICVVVKDVEAYFEEWIDFHLAMEFSNLYIYDDSDNFELRHWYQNTRNHSFYSRVQVLNNQAMFTKENQKIRNRQNFAYHDCMNRFGLDGPKHDYMALIDLDEFFMLQTSKYSGILGVLDDYLAPYGGSLAINWMFVGDANKTVYSPVPVTKRFQYRDDATSPHFKLIVKSTDYFRCLNTHNITLRQGKQHTTEYPGAVEAMPAGTIAGSDQAPPSDILLLYHYRYTSKKEYLYKRCQRGAILKDALYWCSADGSAINGRGSSDVLSSPGTVFDDRPWQFLKARVPKYQMYDQFQDYHSSSGP